MRYLILISLLLTSCSAQWHLKRAIKKDPSIVKPDTFIKYDTTIVFKDRILCDSFYTTEYDTVVVQDSFVYTKVIRIKDKIKVYTKCKGDTIRITEKIQLPPQVLFKEPSPLLRIVSIAMGVVLLLFILKFVLK